MNFLSNLTTNKNAWLLLFISALSLELAALYFQYMMELKPCVMCIYQRAAMWAIVFAGIVGYFTCSSVFGRLIAYGLWATGAIWGLLIANEHVDMQNASMAFLYGCELVPNFPQWAPLHEWLPALFKADGSCSDIDWQFLGYSMPQWMVVIYSVYTALFAAVLLSRLKQTKMF
ncbi:MULTISPECIES: disulfide bond formation protein DsbB [Thalassotalea]|uniref:disulfide bond formation protein DsbB n=1 Tax=Thalassotalea TaxID=1518149 RepID=UPI000943601B|nr:MULTISPECIES: disulfide bond formation protein DsbB [Thalassotalea]OKY25536.1 disulfide bond formation protein B [Thalassotalea sp. PP2-459]